MFEPYKVDLLKHHQMISSTRCKADQQMSNTDVCYAAKRIQGIQVFVMVLHAD